MMIYARKAGVDIKGASALRVPDHAGTPFRSHVGAGSGVMSAAIPDPCRRAFRSMSAPSLS